MIQRSFFDPPPSEPAGYASLAELRSAALVCRRCQLADSRQQVVFGEGDPTARLLVVGEGPSESDDSGGHPFSGPSGHLLDRWLAELGLARDQIWLTNIIKCRSAGLEGGRLVNRPPSARAMSACRLWLSDEIRLVNPACILGLGGIAGGQLSGLAFKITQQRGQWFDGPGGVQTLVTYNPAYLLRLEEPRLGQAQAEVTSDLALIKAALASPSQR